jgi:hypothetical protein
MMIALLAALSTQDEIRTEVIQKLPALKLRISFAVAEGAPPVLGVRRRLWRRADGSLVEFWKEQEAVPWAAGKDKTATATATIRGAGWYAIGMPGREIFFYVSGTGLNGWERTWRSCRQLGESLARVAAEMDAVPTPKPEQIRAWQSRLDGLREVVRDLSDDFSAASRALGEALDRLYCHPSLLEKFDLQHAYPAPPPGSDKSTPFSNSAPSDLVRSIPSTIEREAALHVIDEARCVLDESESASRINRWRDRSEALRELARVAGELVAFPSLRDALQDLRDGRKTEEAARALEEIRAEVLK